MKVFRLCLMALALLLVRPQSEACSRVVYLGDEGIVMVGRTLDWKSPIPTNIYVYPQGIEKTSMPSEPCLKWKSLYASVVAVGYDGGVTEGMNDQGLVMNGLFCKGTIYKESTGSGSTPVVSLAMLVSFFLDNFATVEEVDTWLNNNQFAIFGKTFDGGTVSTLHWALTDATGMTLVIEYENGVMNTYKGKELQVLTNDPPQKQMDAINSYWEKVGGANMLPGTVRSSDRYARASFFIHSVPTDFDYHKAFGALSSIMGTVSVPYGYKIEGEPNVSSTQWTSISDATKGRYYFRQATSQGFLYIDLGMLRTNVGAPILKLDMSKYGDVLGCADKYLQKTPGFAPMW